ncbi:uncharacterized protein LOC110607433 [Manihot esculenta]|uniref:uncharacterized protein LOC110607433 n=1 Tax=Manihot esculenta TaxID=3983 RepID=UPI000B5D89C0|nr:uncharacterized protein LOC110607433 [Manihot esculenta]XP_021602226.1 uncharacterized protein LOC110607433 [Manihot esculenta]
MWMLFELAGYNLVFCSQCVTSSSCSGPNLLPFSTGKMTTNKGKETEKISLRSQTNIIKTNPATAKLITSGPSIQRPLYISSTSIINRPLSPISSALVTQPSYSRPRSPRPNFSPNFTSLNRYSPLQSPMGSIRPITPSTFKQIVSQASSSSQSPQVSQEPSEYKYKPIEDYIITIEPEYWAKNPNLNTYQLCESIFPKTHFYIPDNFNKSQQYYEAILIQTNSILMQNNHDPQYPTKIRYCKVRLLKVWTLAEWGQEPHQTK